MEERVADAIGMVPDILSRLGALENRAMKHVQAQLSDHERDLLEIRRRLGDDAAFSLKARRARAVDQNMGLAAQQPMFDFDELEISETSIASVAPATAPDGLSGPPVSEPLAAPQPLVDVQGRIRMIENKVAEMNGGNLSLRTIETGYGHAFEDDQRAHSLHRRVAKL